MPEKKPPLKVGDTVTDGEAYGIVRRVLFHPATPGRAPSVEYEIEWIVGLR